MKSAPSDAFRRLCLAMALLATTWAVPRRASADAYALQNVKNIVDVLKPNVLILLETAESMQGLAGENAARYNEVGADCEDGNRSCRLAGQTGRWGFTGMGSQGIKFGDPGSSCTATVTDTVTSTDAETATDTSSSISTFVMTSSSTDTRTTTTTKTNTNTRTNTRTNTHTNTNTQTNTLTKTATTTNTKTTTSWFTNTISNTNTSTVTTSKTQTRTNTVTATMTRTNSSTVTRTKTVTNSTFSTGTQTDTSGAYSGSWEAENMTKSTGSAQPPGWALWSNGYVEQMWIGWLDPNRTFVFTVTAKGTPYQGTYARLVFSLQPENGSYFSVGSAYTTADYQDYTFTFTTGATGMNHHMRVTFDNDGSGNGEDRNLFVDKVTKWGPILIGTGTTVTTSTGTGLGTDIATATGLGTGLSTSTATELGASNCASTTASWEAESLSYSSSFASRTYSESGASNGSYVLFNDSPLPTSLEQYIQFTFSLATEGTYTLKLMYKSGTNRARSQASIDGVNVGGLIDEYAASAAQQVEKTAGTVTLAAGSHTLRFTTKETGKGGGYQLVVDKITLEGTSGPCTTTATFTSATTAVGSDTATSTETGTGLVTSTETGTALGTGTETGTGTGTDSDTATGTRSETAVATSTYVQSWTMTSSSTHTAVGSDTGTVTAVQVYPCGSEGSVDPTNCTTATPTTSGFCNEANGKACGSDGTCNITRGDFCRYVSTSDGSTRGRNETCVVSAGSPWGSCKHGVVTANTTCGSSSDASCATALSGDYCAEGQPAKMCADSGLWCAGSLDCPGNALTDTCGGATSRMMTVKRALRRAVTDYADKVSFGFMSTYQGRGLPATATDASTAIYPYVKLQTCPASANMTETKLLTRGELERAGCFDLTNGPAETCTIDYGGNGALNATAAWNQITYTKVGSADSRWVVPRGDGSGKYNAISASWSSCSSSPILPSCVFSGQGTGVYEGSYYSFTYKQGTPIAKGGVPGEGSRAFPVYFTTYRGKFFSDGTNCYNAIDTDRSDIVNDGIFGRPAYTGNPYASANEVGVPWSGANSTAACDATTGASWNSAAVPMLSSADTMTFADKTLNRSQRALMIAARLEKASFGGVAATGRVAPLGCALANEGASDAQHSASAYMSTVRANDTAANGDKAPCWTNNIVLVVDGHSNGPGDLDLTSTIDCASAECAYNAATNPTLAGCNCAAITKAFNLAQAGVQTHVVVNAPATWSTRYPYTYAFLWNLAVAGSGPAFNGTPSFGTSEEEVYRGISEKIAAAAYPFVYTTTIPVAGATTQDPLSKLLEPSKLLFDTSVNYPSWKGNVRAFNTTPTLVWDAIATAAAGHPASWKARRIYFSDASGAVHKVSISSSTGAISNKATLYGAGLGSSADEAERIMQWLLGKPELGNPAPLMGSITASTPIVVGQANQTGQNGSEAYSASTSKRPQLLYVGADDGMLHAFFAPSSVTLPGGGSFQIGGSTFQAGEEAFAFIPLDMFAVINKLYAQGGQNLSADQRIEGTSAANRAHRNLRGDKNHHVFGLAGSPKVKDMCWGSACIGGDGGGWHTVLVMTEGPGGNKPFALDISNVVTETSFNGLSEGSAGTGSLLWSAAVADAADANRKWNKALGETTSVPAFYYRSALGSAANRVLFASGYPTVDRSTSGYGSQGLVLLDVDAVTGAWDATSPHALGSEGASSCTSGARQQQRAILADIALARDWTHIQTSQNLLGAYVVDTWGNTYQYVPGMGALSPALYTLGCGQPLHFSPAVVQLDKIQSGALSAQHQTYLVQVTNSNLDPETRAYSADYPGSQLVVTKLAWSGITGDAPTVDTFYSGSGRIVLATDATDPENRICLKPQTFTKTKTDTCGGTEYELPVTARPVGTPTVIMRSDGLGFQVITSWYDWSQHANDCAGTISFNHGTSYVTVHEFGADGTWYQIAGFTMSDTVLTGGTFVGVGFFLDGIMGGNDGMPAGLNFGQSIVSLQQVLNNAGLERYLRTSWTERVE